MKVIGYYPANARGDIGEVDPICAYCYDVPNDADAPIFSNTEADAPTHCARCGEIIPHALTGDGEAYVRNNPSPAWLEAYTYLFREVE